MLTASASKNDQNLVEQKHAFDSHFDIKTKIHDRLLEMLDLSQMDAIDDDTLKSQVSVLIERILQEDKIDVPLNLKEKQRLIQDIQDEIIGLGPLEPLLRDPTISDILVTTHQKTYVERKGKLQISDCRFKDDEHLMKIIDKIVSSVGRRIDESSPMVDARLADGSRINAIIPPLAIDGPVLSIRRFAVDPLELDDLINFNSLTPAIGEILKGVVKARLNILVSGGTGSGKTTALNVLSRFIPEDERIVTIEDSAELQLKQDHVARLETRTPNVEGKGAVTQRDLVVNSLRMRPDRIIVGEVRGQEAFDMLQAMNTGHDGSLTTIHANTPRDALLRLETMVAMANLDIPTEFVRRFISSALDVIIQASRMADGSRKIISVQEITGMEGSVITLQEIFSFDQTGIDADGKVKGRFRFHGVRPKFMKQLEVANIHINNNVFDASNIVEV